MSTIKVNNITPLTGTHISGSFNGVFSGSIVNSRIDNLENFSSSLDAAFATDVQLHQLYQATSSIHNFTSSIRNEISAIEAWTASLDNTYATDAQLYKLYQTTSSLNNYTGSNDSVLQRIMQTTASLNSKTGSYATTGSNTFNGNQTINGTITLDNNSVIKDNANQSISFGVDAADSGQGTQSTAIGSNAGQTDQGNGATALGALAGNLEQGQSAVAIGALAGSTQQGDWAIAIGAQAGGISQGNYSIALGNLAGGLNQAANSVVINATGTQLDNTTASSLKIAPIRINDDGSENVLVYNTTTKEISYSGDKFATTGSNTFIGTETISGSIFISGSIIPNGSGSYDLGSIEHPWRDLYISTASIKLIRDGEVVNSVSSIISEITASNTVISKETLLIDGNIVVKDGGLRRMRITSGSVRFDVAYDDIDESSEYTNHSLRAYYGASDPDFIDRWGVGLQSNLGNVYLDSPNGNIILSSSILISGSIIPSTNSTSYTSSYSLGSSTNAWKELWVSNGSVNFVDPNSGDTASISLNERNVLSVPQIESIGNLNVTGSLGVAEGLSLDGERIDSESGSIGTFNITFPRAHRIYSNNNHGNFVFHSHYPIHFYLTKLNDENAKLNVTGSVKIHGDRGIGPGVYNPSDTALEVIGNSEISGSIYVSGSNSTIVLPNHSSAPSSPNSGALYFNTTDFHFYGWNGGQWKQLDN